MCCNSNGGSISPESLGKFLRPNLFVLIHHLLRYGAEGFIERLCQSISQRLVSRGGIPFNLTWDTICTKSRSWRVDHYRPWWFRNTKSVDDVDPNKLDHFSHGEIPQHNCVSPFGEIIYHVRIYLYSHAFSKGSTMSIPHYANGHEWLVASRCSSVTLRIFRETNILDTLLVNYV